MLVDDYPHDFAYLASRELPLKLQELRQAMARPQRMRDFAQRGAGEAAMLKALGRDRDFPGCYVLLKDSTPVYVGISRGVVKRLLQHVKGTTHNDASLAYRIATDTVAHGMSRAEAMKDHPGMPKAFQDAKQYLAGLDVAFVEIDNPLVLHVFEPYAALVLRTGRWNTFRTH